MRRTRPRRSAILLGAILGSATGAALAQTPPPAPPAETEVMYQGEATGILGRIIRDPAGDTVGRIVDVLVDDQGQPRAAVIDFGGFMGVGNRRIAVVWRALHFQPAAQHDQILLDMTADQIKAIPDYKGPAKTAGPPVTMAAPPAPASPAQ